MTHSTTTDYDEYFIDGVNDADLGFEMTLAKKIMSIYSFDDELKGKAYYDGYIRRKHGLVDENGEEV